MVKRIIILVSAILIALIIGVLASLGTIATHVVNKHGEEFLGREVHVDQISIHLLSGNVRIDEIQIKEADKSRDFVTLSRLEVGISIVDLLTQQLTVEELIVDGVAVNVEQTGAQFNFSDLIARFASEEKNKEEEEITEPSAWSVALHNLELKNSSIYYKDKLIDGKWNLRNISLKIPVIHFDNNSTDIALNFNFSDGGRLSTKISYDIMSGRYYVNSKLANFELISILPYLRQQLNIDEVEGKVDFDVMVEGNLTHLLDITTKGSVALANLRIKDIKNQELLLLDSLFVDVDSIDLGKSRFVFNQIYLYGIKSSFLYRKDGSTNFSNLVKEQPKESKEEEISTTNKKQEELLLKINKLELANGDIKIEDQTPSRSFGYRIHRLNVSANDFSLSGRNKIEVEALLQDKGSVRVNWDGDFEDLSNLKLLADIRNVSLRDFSPYVEDLFAYPLVGGNLSFYSHNIISNNQLTGINNLGIFSPVVDKKMSDKKAEYNVPLKLGLYILTDIENKVKLELPVKGNIDEPEFSYKKLIIKTLVNVFVKVAATPASFLGNALGMKDDPFKAFDFDPTSESIDVKLYGKLNEYANVLTQKPDLCLNLQENFNWEKIFEEQLLHQMKLNYYSTQIDTITQPSLIDKSIIDKISDSDSGLKLYVDSLYTNAGDSVMMNHREKIKYLIGEQVEQALIDSHNTRKKVVEEYLYEQLKMTPEMIKMDSLVIDSIRSYRGRSLIEVKMDVK